MCAPAGEAAATASCISWRHLDCACISRCILLTAEFTCADSADGQQVEPGVGSRVQAGDKR